MTLCQENIALMLRNLGANLGTRLALDDRGALALDYANGRSCLFAVVPGRRMRIGMIASLFPCPAPEQLDRALRMNAGLERDSGVLAIDGMGALIFTALRDADNLSEESLAAFMGDFMSVSVELHEALRILPDAPPALAFAEIKTAQDAILC